MRIVFSIIFACLIVALLYCSAVANRSTKSIGKSVRLLLLALIPPLVGNLVLVASTNQTLSTVGFYVYFIGMDVTMLGLLRFTEEYCFISAPKALRIAVGALILLDMLQLLANIFTGHAFGVEEIVAYGAPYFRLIPYAGQTFHRILDYAIIAAVIIIFFVKVIRSPRISSERYSVILICIIITTIWETVYIFSRTPVDRSMIGFGVFGLLVFYFSLYYHPFRLLDRMLVTAASEIPDALFFFDMDGNCLWANKRAVSLVGIDENHYEVASSRLDALFGDSGKDESRWAGEHIIGDGEAMRSYVATQRVVTDDKNRPIGSFLTVRDNSDEQKTLKREIYNATHDSLTGVYNRAGYDLLMSHLDLDSTLMILIDGDNFKLINDEHGHEVGDRALQKIAHAIERSFRSDDRICRYGGDEFIVLVSHVTPSQSEHIRARINHINDELANTEDGLPATSISAGCAFGSEASDGAELFEHADRALYEAKRGGRRDVAFYSTD
ncbi:MAG: diguanylate cyclase [Eggerthellaceae bacterium]|nr:diguanylate cyclase [Eggerthellaceae bacterium]